MNWIRKSQEAAAHVRKHWDSTPQVGIILGSGLGSFADQIQHPVTLSYDSLPHFPTSTVMGHQGQLVCGQIENVPVMAMQGRFHLYEGHQPSQATLPIRVMKYLGVEVLIVSNASGGLNPSYQSGDIMVIEDHLNLMFANPLIGPHDERMGDRFPDMSQPYNRKLIDQATQLGHRHNLRLHRGVYAAMLGPSYETRAEYRMLRFLGADAAGMSTVPEVLAAVQAKMRVLAFSVIANVCQPDTLDETSGQTVVDVAGAAEPQLTKLIRAILAEPIPASP